MTGVGVIAREEELAALTAFVEGSTDRSCLTLAGDAGVGKTTLWRAGVETARQRSVWVLAASPAEAEARMSFAALDDLLSGVVEDVLPTLPGPQRHALEVALLLTEAQAPALDQRAVAVAFLNGLRALSATAPVLVAVDDVQWLDTASASVLGYAARRVNQAPIRFLFTERTDGVVRRLQELGHVLRSDRATSIRVGPLTLGALHRLLHAGHQIVLPRPVLQRVHQTSGGNPFYALEIARAFEHEGVRPDPGQPLAIPPSLGEILRGRIETLPAETRTALLVAAAVTEPRVDILAAALGADPDAALDPAIETQIVSLEDNAVRFAHPLLAAASYSAAAESERRRIHLLLSTVVGDPEERARHQALASEGPDEAVAAALELAAVKAWARGATEAAAELCEEAGRLTPPELERERQRRTIETARYRFLAGDTSSARLLLEQALPALRGGTMRAEALELLQRLHRYEGDQPRAAELAWEALTEAGADDRVRAAAAQGLASTLFFMRERLEVAQRHIELASKLSAGEASPAFQLQTLGQKAVLEAVRGARDAEETFLAAERLDADALVGFLSSARWSRTYVRLWADDVASVAPVIRACHEEALARGDEGSIPTILVSWALADYLTGRWREAARLAEDGYELALQVGQQPQQAWALSMRAVVHASLGSEAETRADAAAATALAGDRGMAVARIHSAWALGLLALSLDEPSETVRVITPLRRQLIAAGVGEPGSIRFVPDEIEALIALDDPEALELLAWLEERGHALGRPSALGAAARCRGLLAARSGDLAEALVWYERALAHHVRAPIPFEHARTLFAQGSTLRRARKLVAARECLASALAGFAELGAALWMEKAQAELARIGGRAPSPEDLTPSERRVAQLVAEGGTNKEVAAALVLSERTVEYHLSHIYRKLGLRSRSELARKFTS